MSKQVICTVHDVSMAIGNKHTCTGNLLHDNFFQINFKDMIFDLYGTYMYIVRLAHDTKCDLTTQTLIAVLGVKKLLSLLINSLTC